MKINVLQEKLDEVFRLFENKTALIYEDYNLTYKELEIQRNRVANWLVGQQVKKGSRVGVYVGRKMDVIVLMIGILKAGCVFVPLDSANPGERLDRMTQDAKLDVLFADSLNLGKYPTDKYQENHDTRVVNIDKLMNSDQYVWEDSIEYFPDDDIYIYFTSGSTGFPKAVMGRNQSLLHYIEWEVEAFEVSQNDNLLQLASIGFDAFLKEVFVALFSGATLCILSSVEVMLYPGELIDLMEKYRISILHCVPGIFRLFNSFPLTGKEFSHLKYILLSGEIIYPSDLEKWYKRFDGRIQLVNLYGTTETTILSTFYPLNKTDINRGKIPVGKPIKGTEIIILNPEMKECEAGEVGELYICNTNCTKGYCNDIELNTKKFVRLPSVKEVTNPLYKTGDLGRILPDGNLELQGRIDRQVKLRGIRIELGEIESQLSRHPEVQEAVVLKKESSNKNEWLVGYVTQMAEQKTDKEIFEYQLKSFLSQKIPDYMIPSHIIFLETMPRHANGKINRQTLESIFNEETCECVTPKNQIEKKLLEFWMQIIGIEKMGVTHSFFDLGGNSINVMSLISMVHQEFDVRIPVKEILKSPTIEKQAEFILQTSQEQMGNLEVYPS
jgi:amino acid adenylation domain-containing protein